MARRANGRLIGGVTVHYVRDSADISSRHDADNGGGRIRTDGYGHGGTLTGFYLDTQGQANWYDSDLSFAGGGIPLVEGDDGFGYRLRYRPTAIRIGKVAVLEIRPARNAGPEQVKSRR